MQQGLRESAKEIEQRIAQAAQRAGRQASEIKLVAVSKTHPAETLREAIEADLRVFGENKIQEAEAKISELGREKLEWHLIGHLQSNKVRKAVKLFDVIHTLDSIELAQRLERICSEENRSELSVLTEVDLAGEATKSGITEKDLPELIKYLQTCERLKFDGLMIVPPFDEDVEKTRVFFKKLREMRDDLLKQEAFANQRGELSMGMSHDYETAIEEGATIVRVGTAIFGAREYKKPDA